MASLCLDPILFACPSLAKNAGDFDSCVQNILGLHEELININWAEIYTTDKTMDALFSANAYPVCQNIKTVICQFGITYAQPQDIFRVIMALIKKSQFIEKRLGIRDVLITQNKSSPTDHLAGRHPAFVENYNHLLVMMHLDCFFLKTEEKEQVLITKNLCNDPEQIKISGEIGVFDFEDNTRTVQVPHKVTGIFKACGSIKQLLSVLNPVSLWMRSLSDDGRNKAIEIWLFQKYNTTGNGWKFGRNFLPSAIKLGFCNEEGKVKKLLRSCAETVLKEPAGTHALREGPGPADPQRKRGNGDLAWRRDIDREFHLHYWVTSNGPEFADVVQHRDMTITD